MNVEKSNVEKSHEQAKDSKLDVSEHAQPVEVPVFGCIVYVTVGEGDVHARVANLEGLEATAASEREALAKIVPAFKERVSQLMQDKTPIPWIDPPPQPNPGEQKRFIPVHL